MGEFKKGILLRDLILLALSNVKEFIGIGNLMSYVEGTSFKDYGFEIDRVEIKEEIFDLFLSHCISIEDDPKQDKDKPPENLFKIREKGKIILSYNNFFREIAKSFPFEKEEKKKK